MKFEISTMMNPTWDQYGENVLSIEIALFLNKDDLVLIG